MYYNLLILEPSIELINGKKFLKFYLIYQLQAAILTCSKYCKSSRKGSKIASIPYFLMTGDVAIASS